MRRINPIVRINQNCLARMSNLRTNLWLIVALMMISILLSASKKNITSGSTGENSKVVVGTTQEMQLDRTLDSQSIPEGGLAYYKISIIQDFYVKNNIYIYIYIIYRRDIYIRVIEIKASGSINREEECIIYIYIYIYIYMILYDVDI